MNNGAKASFRGPGFAPVADALVKKRPDIKREAHMSFNVKDEKGNLHDVSMLDAVIVNGRIFRPEE